MRETLLQPLVLRYKAPNLPEEGIGPTSLYIGLLREGDLGKTKNRIKVCEDKLIPKFHMTFKPRNLSFRKMSCIHFNFFYRVT